MGRCRFGSACGRGAGARRSAARDCGSPIDIRDEVPGDNRIRLNICPTSNVLLGRVESLAEHTIRELYDAGVKLTVNTDDVLVFGQSVSDEFLNLYRAGLFSAAELNELRWNGLSDDPVLDQTNPGGRRLAVMSEPSRTSDARMAHR